MDKYEYKLRTEQLLEFMDEGDYTKAAEIADTIDWSRVKNESMLSTVGDIYEKNGNYSKSYEILKVLYNNSDGSRKIVYRLGLLALHLRRVDEAIDYYDEFMQIAPKDPNQYILKYKILRAKGEAVEQQIEALEEFKKAEYIEKWAYELAKLYQEAGMTAECLEECDDLILWFSEGEYVYKAMELKMQYKPLTPSQMEKYNNRKETELSYSDIEDEEADVSETGDNFDNEDEIVARESEKSVDAGPIKMSNIIGSISNSVPLADAIHAIIHDKKKKKDGIDSKSEQMLHGEESENETDETLDLEEESKFGAEDSESNELEEDRNWEESELEEDENWEEEELEEDEDWEEDELEEGESWEELEEDEDWEEDELEEDESWEEEELEEDENWEEEELEEDENWEEDELEEDEDWIENTLEGKKNLEDNSLEEGVQEEKDILKKETERNNNYECREISESKSKEVDDQITGQMSLEDILADWDSQMLQQENATEKESDEDDDVQQLMDEIDLAEIEAEEFVLTDEEAEEFEEDFIEETSENSRESSNELMEESTDEVLEATDVDMSKAVLKEIESLEDYEEEFYDEEPELEESEESNDKESELEESEESNDEESELEESEDFYDEGDESEEDEEYYDEEDESEEDEEYYDEEDELEEDEEFYDEEDELEEDEEFYDEEDELEEDEEYYDEEDEIEEDEEYYDEEDELEEDEEYYDEEDESEEDEEFYDEEDESEDEEFYDEESELEEDEELYDEEDESEEEDYEDEYDEDLDDDYGKVYGDVREVTLDNELKDFLDSGKRSKKNLDDREIDDDDDFPDLLASTTPLSRKETAKLIATGKTAPLPLDEISNALSMSDTGFIVHGRYDLETQSGVGTRAGLTEEQKKLFSYFVPVRGMSEQLVDVLEQDKNCTNRHGTSCTGNLLIIGRKGSGKTVLAVDVVKAIQRQRNVKQGKVAIVTGDSLNKKRVSDIVSKLYGGALIIEKAGKMNERTVAKLNKAMESDTGEMLIVLEEQRKPLDRLLTSNREFRRKFTSRLEVPIFINDELVTFGQTYARENGYRIDEMGILALYSRIDALQREDHAVTVSEVKEVMDEAIEHSQRASAKRLVKRVFGRGTDEADRIILSEKDFNI